MMTMVMVVEMSRMMMMMVMLMMMIAVNDMTQNALKGQSKLNHFMENLLE